MFIYPYCKVTNSDQLYFLQEDLIAIDKNILSVPKEHIDLLFKKIDAHAKTEKDKKNILEELLQFTQKRKEYYYKKQNQHMVIGTVISPSACIVYYDSITLTISLLLALLPLLIFLYFLRIYFFIPKQIELAHAIAQNINDQIHNLRADRNITTVGVLLFVIIYLIFSIKLLYRSIHRWRNPQYKEHYKKLCSLERQIQRKLLK